MWRALLRAALAAGLVGAAAADDAPHASDTGIRTSPALVGQCVIVHGQLRWHANGRPYLAPAGTRRLIGFPREIEGLSRWLPETVDPAAPGSIYARAAPLQPDESDLVGDFEICPVSREKPRVMQMSCLAEASHLKLHPKRSGSAGN
jgi:hypothetical protein